MVEFVDQYNQYQRTVRIFRVVIRNIRKASANCKTSEKELFFIKSQEKKFMNLFHQVNVVHLNDIFQLHYQFLVDDDLGHY